MASPLYIDLKYAGMVSSRLRNYISKGKGASSFTHSCERQESRKRRGYLLPYNGTLIFKCHNCGVAQSFSKFLESTDQLLYKEYRLEVFKEKMGSSAPKKIEEAPVTKVEPVQVKGEFEGLISYKDLKETHPAYGYLLKRKIPKEKIELFYLAPKFYSWAKRFDDAFEKFTKDVPRLVLPYYDKDGSLLGFSCRAFDSSKPKYIQLRLDKSKEFLYGTNEIDPRKPIIAVEGQIDSLFLDNSIAVGSANYNSPYLMEHKDNVIVVPDNDFRRNPEVCTQLKKAIDRGLFVSILPSHWRKDINDIVKKDGVSKEELMNYILSHKKNGAAALLELTLEKRC